jgi:uncharacterized protein (TIGR02246 family)
MNAGSGTHEDDIRAARDRSNRAIADRDLDAIASVWMEDILVLGSTSARLLGAEAGRRFYAAQFARRPDTAWVRTPTTVSALSPWGVALEEGDWSGRWTEPDGPIALHGRYMAQWVRTPAGWRIQGEVYVPTACVGGAYCARPPGS